MELIYTDKDLAVCVKPVGVDSEHQVPALLKEQLGGEVFPIHRLDLNVGGLMVYARTKAAAAALSKAVQDGSLIKEYVALVHGAPRNPAIGRIFCSRTAVRIKYLWSKSSAAV